MIPLLNNFYFDIITISRTLTFMQFLSIKMSHEMKFLKGNFSYNSICTKMFQFSNEKYTNVKFFHNSRCIEFFQVENFPFFGWKWQHVRIYF